MISDICFDARQDLEEYQEDLEHYLRKADQRGEDVMYSDQVQKETKEILDDMKNLMVKMAALRKKLDMPPGHPIKGGDGAPTDQ